jgi:xylulose-5-phosphate/fructose-6-phosphate phosphoketolase
MKTKTLSPELLHKMDAYWRAANYLSVGQIYLTTILCSKNR